MYPVVSHPLEAARIEVAAYTASFRVPSFVGYQLTLPVPPLSTVFGLISAAAGRWVMPHDVDWLAYRCTYEGKAFDTETIVQIEREKPHKLPQPKMPPKTKNIAHREFLLFPRLTLYLPSSWTQVFRYPRFALLLGRTQDVAYVASITITELSPVSSGVVSGVLLPFELLRNNRVTAWMHNLPTALTNSVPRYPVRMHLFGVVDVSHPAYLDRGDGWLTTDVQHGATVVLYRREWILSGQ